MRNSGASTEAGSTGAGSVCRAPDQSREVRLNHESADIVETGLCVALLPRIAIPSCAKLMAVKIIGPAVSRTITVLTIQAYTRVLPRRRVLSSSASSYSTSR